MAYIEHPFWDGKSWWYWHNKVKVGPFKFEADADADADKGLRTHCRKCGKVYYMSENDEGSWDPGCPVCDPPGAHWDQC